MAVAQPLLQVAVVSVDPVELVPAHTAHIERYQSAGTNIEIRQEFISLKSRNHKSRLNVIKDFLTFQVTLRQAVIRIYDRFLWFFFPPPHIGEKRPKRQW